MLAFLIFCLARVIRCAIVVSGTRNACAISATVSPPSSRSVRATRFSGASAGWQQVKMRRSRSSSTGPVGSGGVSSVIIAASAYFVSRTFSRRIRSSALRFAVVVSQPPGLGGGPSTGHFSSATTSASERASSARSMSPKRRIRPARTRPCSARTMASTAPSPAACCAGRGHAASNGRTSTLAGTGGRPAAGDVERGVEVRGLDDPEAAEVLLRLGERPVGDDRLRAGAVDHGAVLDRLQAAGEDPAARGLQLLR